MELQNVLMFRATYVCKVYGKSTKDDITGQIQKVKHVHLATSGSLVPAKEGAASEGRQGSEGCVSVFGDIEEQRKAHVTGYSRRRSGRLPDDLEQKNGTILIIS